MLWQCSRSGAHACAAISWMITWARFWKCRSQWMVRRCLLHLMTTPRKYGAFQACIQAGDLEHVKACHRMDSQSTSGHVETTWPEGFSIGPTGGCRPAQDMVGHSTGTCGHKITIIFSPPAEGRPANEDERSPLRPNKRRQSDCDLSRPDPETVPSRRA